MPFLHRGEYFSPRGVQINVHESVERPAWEESGTERSQAACFCMFYLTVLRLSLSARPERREEERR